MTVYLPKGCRTYRFDFEWRGHRYTGSTGMSRLGDAREFERKERVRLERQAGDLSLRANETPRIQDWAEVFYAHKTDARRPRKLKRPDILEREIRVVLEFCGAAPTRAPAPAKRGAPPRRATAVSPPYHDLRLGDFIEQPEWIVEFERWLAQRGTGGSARNHYRTVMSGMFKVAMLPEHRRLTGVRSNPFAGVERDRPVRRRVTQTVEDLRSWVQHAAPHVRLALAIGALAPALRLGSILRLRWDTHVDRDLKYFTITDHKGDQATPEPIVIPIVAQLAEILAAARTAWQVAREKDPKTPSNIVQFRRRELVSIKKGLRAAAGRAHVAYGVGTGATFHTLRHTMSTILAGMGVAEGLRKELLAHQDIATTQIYTHLRPVHLVAPLEQLSEAVSLGDIVSQPARLPTRGRNKPSGKSAGHASGKKGDSQGKHKQPEKAGQRHKTQNRPTNTRRIASRRRAS